MPDGTYADVLESAARALQQALGLDQAEARLEALLLICHCYAVSKSSMLARLREPAAANPEFDALLARRLRGEPVAYIFREREFYGLEFEVNPAVLIPRPETELLVELSLALTATHPAAAILELGTGSGAIAISLAHHRATLSITATDVSSAALEVAARNGLRHGIANIDWQRSDWFTALRTQAFDLIVSNPPYVAEDDPHLERGDLRFEPLGALASGPDGLNAIRIIVAHAPAFLRRGGWLLLEHGYDQGERCRELLQRARFSHVETRRDLAQLERVSMGRWQSSADTRV